MRIMMMMMMKPKNFITFYKKNDDDDVDDIIMGQDKYEYEATKDYHEKDEDKTILIDYNMTYTESNLMIMPTSVT